MMPPQRIERLVESDEVAWDQTRSLMDQLVKRVLPIGSRLTPIDRSGIRDHACSIERHMLAVALHRQLLQIGWEPLEVLFIRQNSYRLCVEEVGVPNRQQPQK